MVAIHCNLYNVLSADYYIIVPSLLSVGLSFWAVQYALRGLSFMASYTPDYLAGDMYARCNYLP